MTTTRKSESCCGEASSAGEAESSSAAGCCAAPRSTTDAGTASACCDPRSESPPDAGVGAQKQSLRIDFMYLDLSVCARCQDTESTLETAIEEVSRVLETTGVEVTLNKIQVTGEQQARDLGFLVSPTIRVNNRDIQMNYRESLCDTCGTLCDCEGGVSCREWEYQGQWYTAPPKGMIIESILRMVYGGAAEAQPEARKTEAAPDNLKKFFSGLRDQDESSTTAK